MKYALYSLAFFFAGCSPSASTTLSANHPASVAAPAPTLYADPSALPAAPQPDLPEPLRPDTQPPGEMAGMDHGQMDHGQMDHGQMDHGQMDHGQMDHGQMDHGQMDHGQMDHGQMPEAQTPNGLAVTLDAYLDIQEALATDRFADIPAQAEALYAALAALIAAPPANDPHFWHERMGETDALRTHTQALTEATDLASARAAFGALSLPFVTLIKETGTPEGYDLSQYTCGMADAPEGGVWLQRGDETMNPYFGTAMPSCGSSDAVLPTAPVHNMEGHDGH